MANIVLVIRISADNSLQFNNLISILTVRRIFGNIDDKSYAYFPFEFDDNQVKLISNNKVLPNSWANLNGYTLRTVSRQNFPKTFVYLDEKGNTRITGTFGEQFEQFIRRHNATFTVTDLDENATLALELTRNNEIDINMLIVQNMENVSFSPSLSLLKYSIVMVRNDFVNPAEYFVRPFSSGVWICIIGTVAYVTLVDIILRTFTNSKTDIWTSFSQVFLILLDQGPEQPTTYAYRLYAQVSVFAFIIGNIYTIYLSSFLTVFIPVKQYDTIQELVDNNIPVLIVDYQFEALKEFNTVYPKVLDNIIMPVSSTLYNNLVRPKYNPKYALALYKDSITVLEKVQALGQRPMFHVCKEDIVKYYVGFLMPEYSPFKEYLDQMIVEIAETGLLEKWESDFPAFLINSGDFGRWDKFDDDYDGDVHKPLKLQHLSTKLKTLPNNVTKTSVDIQLNQTNPDLMKCEY
ncbi:uncharacterized protein LOC129909747 [Episyrphus balteatus]|uniref:uncharacterized protein LOC129909747 n=1 Tax=Episyrphus balteatus TaxID=286459 RepID=UPI00248503E6|nr:uncharacterized protein LOC129909747 [Episyrphus balteatus]